MHCSSHLRVLQSYRSRTQNEMYMETIYARMYIRSAYAEVEAHGRVELIRGIFPLSFILLVRRPSTYWRNRDKWTQKLFNFCHRSGEVRRQFYNRERLVSRFSLQLQLEWYKDRHLSLFLFPFWSLRKKIPLQSFHSSCCWRYIAPTYRHKLQTDLYGNHFWRLLGKCLYYYSGFLIYLLLCLLLIILLWFSIYRFHLFLYSPSFCYITSPAQWRPDREEERPCNMRTEL